MPLTRQDSRLIEESVASGIISTFGKLGFSGRYVRVGWKHVLAEHMVCEYEKQEMLVSFRGRGRGNAKWTSDFCGGEECARCGLIGVTAFDAKERVIDGEDVVFPIYCKSTRLVSDGMIILEGGGKTILSILEVENTNRLDSEKIWLIGDEIDFWLPSLEPNSFAGFIYAFADGLIASPITSFDCLEFGHSFLRQQEAMHCFPFVSPYVCMLQNHYRFERLNFSRDTEIVFGDDFMFRPSAQTQSAR